MNFGDTSILDKKVQKQIRRGDIRISASLDMHGMFQKDAFNKLRMFVDSNYKQNNRWLLVITGKGEDGQGVLKREVPRFIANTDLVKKILFIDYAHPKHGGDGALYILLRKNKNLLDMKNQSL